MSDTESRVLDQRGALERWITVVWYGTGLVSILGRILLLPFSLIFLLLLGLRALAYAVGLRRAARGHHPVVVVGNLTVGGSGKTPMVIWLIEALAEAGLRAAVVSRGYGGLPGARPLRVDTDTDPVLCGDEPLLIARRTGALVVVHPDRVSALLSIAADEADVVIADDGLQHLAMARDFEIAVIDGERGLGNHLVIPAGPLRELPRRLQQVDAVVLNQSDTADRTDGLHMRLEPTSFVCPARGIREPIENWRGQRVGALAGIGNPARFFDTLHDLGIEVVEARTLPDHAHLGAAELSFEALDRVVMTEKDAVRAGHHLTGHHWYLEVSASLYDDRATDTMLADLVGRLTLEAS
jgi:tetraacyldisaccharide 4'-kinase